jgi:non-homologous end joining protein Ku
MDGAVHFHLLHDRDHEWLKHMVNPVTGEVTEGAEIHRGLEVERGKFGLLTGEELSAAADGA